MWYTQEIISRFDYSDIVYEVELLIRDQLNPKSNFKLTVKTYAVDKENTLLAKITFSPESIDSISLCVNLERIGYDNDVCGYCYIGDMVDVVKYYCNYIKSRHNHYSSDTWECVGKYEDYLMEGASLWN